MLTLRSVSVEDIELLHAWRNDPESRANSHYTGIVDREMFGAKIRELLDSPHSQLFIGEIDGVAVGHVRIDSGMVSFMVAPEHRRQGIGRALVAAIMDRSPLIAEVKPGNEASRRIFESLGWHLDTLTYRR